ncbi:MAG: GNAT family N-acetyltransferase [Thermomicrobiales bacterium]|nr:GNAT family N-acetyltransferase [Thermomicrobiales bacterium]
MSRLRIVKLERSHALDAFDCGQPDLNRFLTRFALTNQLAGASTTYAGLSGDDVIGFYSLVVGEVEFDGVPERLARGLARHPVPLMVLARLAVDIHWQGKGVGAGLLKDAMLRTLNVAGIVGIRALVVHAKDESAVSFYRHFDFMPSPTDPLHLFLLLKDLRRATKPS